MQVKSKQKDYSLAIRAATVWYTILDHSGKNSVAPDALTRAFCGQLSLN